MDRARQTSNEPGQLSHKTVADMSDEQLLELFLSMPAASRDQQFIDTARAAEMAGVSRRTIQIWAECRLIRALRIGKRYRVSLVTLREYLRTELSARPQSGETSKRLKGNGSHASAQE